MKHTVIGVMAALAFAVSASGCGASSSAESGNSNSADSQADARSSEEKASEERAAMAPEEYSDRILSVEDVPSDFTLDEDIKFGEKSEDDGNVFGNDESPSEEDRSLVECASSDITDLGKKIDGSTAMRSFSATFDSSASIILSSLSRPQQDPKTLVSEIRSDLEKCSSVEPATLLGQQVESVEIFEPENVRGDGVCTVTFDGTFQDSNTFVSSVCVVAWAGDLMMVGTGAVKQGPTRGVDTDVVDGVKSQMSDDLLPIALQKSGFAAA